MMGSCGSCDYSVPVEGDAEGLLECHRHAIRVVGVDDEGCAISAFPVCEPGMWCGDFRYTVKLDYGESWAGHGPGRQGAPR